MSVCAGIDAGSFTSKLGYSDSLGIRVIARPEGFDLNALREEAEVFFDEPVFSCVIAIPESYSQRQRDDIKARAKSSGFRNITIITRHEALSSEAGRLLVWDFGNSGSDIFVAEGGGVLESIRLDVCGCEFDRVFSEYLADRSMTEQAGEGLVTEARRVKHVLSDEDSVTWRRGIVIFREEFERLIYFPVKRAAHYAQRLMRVHKPERVIITGGCSKIPVVMKVISEVLKVKPELDEDIIVRGASVIARMQGSVSAHKDTSDIPGRLRALRGGIIEIEARLTRQQKDRLYVMFRQAEGMKDEGVITLMENMMRELRHIISR